MKIQATINIPPGDTCFYPPADGDARGYVCEWALRHTAARKRWCKIFDDADVTDGYKCPGCRSAAHKEGEGNTQ